MIHLSFTTVELTIIQEQPHLTNDMKEYGGVQRAAGLHRLPEECKVEQWNGN
jgi:hypothetical protein